MNKEKWAKIERLVDQALSYPVDDRTSFVDEACRQQPELKEEVLELLVAINKSEGWLENFAPLEDFFH